VMPRMDDHSRRCSMRCSVSSMISNTCSIGYR
jgi:hypothetical protein